MKIELKDIVAKQHISQYGFIRIEIVAEKHDICNIEISYACSTELPEAIKNMIQNQLFSYMHEKGKDVVKINFIRKHHFKPFSNPERNRNYGVRVGDIVKMRYFRHEPLAEVVGLGLGDNNCCYVRRRGCIDNVKMVAEHCEVQIKVEDRFDPWCKCNEPDFENAGLYCTKCYKPIDI